MADATANATGEQQAPSPSAFLVRAGLVFTGWAALHLAVIGALAHRAVPGGWWTFLAIIAILVALTMLILRSFRDAAHPGAFHRVYVVRPFWYVQLGLPFLSLAGGIGWIVGLPFGRAESWAQVVLAAMAILLALVYAAGFLGSKRLVVKRLTFEYADLPEAFDGIRIAQLSDLHVGPHSSARFLRRIARAVEKEGPDIIAHTGDQVDDYHEDTPRFTSAFADLAAPLGTYAIAGNHDLYAGWARVRAQIERSGIRVLVNDAIAIRRGETAAQQGADASAESPSAEIWIAGTGDPAAIRTWGEPAPDAVPDIARTYEKIPAGAFTIVLAHNPALWRHLLPREPRLTLSGHTHHGQFSIPAINWSLASPFLQYAMGTYESGVSKLYINPGTNYWGLPFRLGAWPEVTMITLRRKAIP